VLQQVVNDSIDFNQNLLRSSMQPSYRIDTGNRGLEVNFELREPEAFRIKGSSELKVEKISPCDHPLASKSPSKSSRKKQSVEGSRG
jgi:hypothetical protein